jgi:hypothetical protein
VVRLLEKSNKNEKQSQIEMAQLGQSVKLVRQGSQEVRDEEGNTITQ